MAANLFTCRVPRLHPSTEITFLYKLNQRFKTGPDTGSQTRHDNLLPIHLRSVRLHSLHFPLPPCFPPRSPPPPPPPPKLITLRHCDCIYYQDWHRTRPLRPPSTPNFRPGVHRLPPASNGVPGVKESIFSNTEVVESRVQDRPSGRAGGLPFDEEAKLVYGVVLSLRNMVKKLSGR